MMNRATCASSKGSTTGKGTRSFRAGFEASMEVAEVARVQGRPTVFPVFGLTSTLQQ